METFNFVASYGTSADHQPRILTLKMGDGYEQSSPDGINNSPLAINVVFAKRTTSEAAAIVAFLRARNGIEPFQWTPPPPYSSLIGFSKWKCKKWTHAINETNNETVSGVFEQTYSLISGPPVMTADDPLFGIGFALRLQTHNGNGVPLGLYKDTACTIPAFTDGDVIAAWRDELSNSGLIALQATSSKRPVLKITVEKPALRFDGVDDFMTVTFARAAQPRGIAALLKDTGSGPTSNSTYFDSQTVNTGRLFAAPSLGYSFVTLYSGAQVSNSTAAFRAWASVVCNINGASSVVRVNGVEVSGNSGGSTANNLSIMAEIDGTSPSQGDISAVLEAGFAFSPEQRATIDAYLQSLL